MSLILVQCIIKKKKYASKENFLAVEIRESSDVDGEVQLPLLYYGEKG